MTLVQFGITALSFALLAACSSNNSNTAASSSSDNTSKSSENSGTYSTSSISEKTSTSEESDAKNPQVEALLTEYDAFIQKIKDTSNKVSGMDDMEKMSIVTDFVQEQASISEKYNALKEDTLSTVESNKLLNKSIDMTQEYNTLIAKLQEK
ncbi:MAG: hypothetical protein ACLSXK_04830 [Lactococcus petauri]